MVFPVVDRQRVVVVVVRVFPPYPFHTIIVSL